MIKILNQMKKSLNGDWQWLKLILSEVFAQEWCMQTGILYTWKRLNHFFQSFLWKRFKIFLKIKRRCKSLNFWEENRNRKYFDKLRMNTEKRVVFSFPGSKKICSVESNNIVSSIFLHVSKFRIYLTLFLSSFLEGIFFLTFVNPWIDMNWKTRCLLTIHKKIDEIFWPSHTTLLNS